jgi:hypothetical protein
MVVSCSKSKRHPVERQMSAWSVASDRCWLPDPMVFSLQGQAKKCSSSQDGELQSLVHHGCVVSHRTPSICAMGAKARKLSPFCSSTRCERIHVIIRIRAQTCRRRSFVAETVNSSWLCFTSRPQRVSFNKRSRLCGRNWQAQLLINGVSRTVVSICLARIKTSLFARLYFLIHCVQARVQSGTNMFLR